MIDKGIKELAGNKEELEILEMNFQTLEEMYELKLEKLSTTKADLKKAIEVIENLRYPKWGLTVKHKAEARAFLQSMKGRE